MDEPAGDVQRDAPADAPSVDAVVTWVDGADPAHRAKLEAYLASIGRTPPAARAARFHDAGEIDWCLASIARHAPWLGRVFIVTDAQRPPVLARLAGTPLDGRVHLVDHRALFAGFERVKFPARGRNGGGAGRRGRVALASGVDLKPKGLQVVPAGDRLIVEMPGGGGMGLASERDRALVERDVRLGYISPEAAERDFGRT